MAQVFLREGEHLEELIKRFKKKVHDEKIMIDYRKKQYFVKPSAERYEKEKKAKHKRFLKSLLNKR